MGAPLAEPIAIEFKNVSFSYDGSRYIFENIDLKIHQGEKVCIVGKNGAGKSTLAKLIDALLLPDEGSVEILGLDTAREEDLTDIRSSIGYVFQNPAEQIVSTIVKDDVAFGLCNLGLCPESIERSVERALKAIKISDLKDRDVNSLSGGQIQRVAIAGCLAMGAQILIFDETTSMLDPDAANDMREIIGSLHEEGKTIIMITHAKEDVGSSDRLIVLSGSNISFDGEPNDRIIRELFPAFPTRSEIKSDLKASTDLPMREHIGCSEDSSILCNRASSASSVIEAKDVLFSYEKERGNAPAQGSFILSIPNLKICRGEILCINGSNGSGKSTFIKLLNGLVLPDSGTISYNGVPTTDKGGRLNARDHVGLVLQYPEKQLFSPTVFDDIAFGLRNQHRPEDEIVDKVKKAMDSLSLDFATLSNMNPFSLSRGEKRKVAIAGVLALEPDVLVFDEPFSGLDIQSHIEFLYLLEKFQAEGHTIVIVSHDPIDIQILADRSITFEEGRIASVSII